MQPAEKIFISTHMSRLSCWISPAVRGN